MHIKWQQKGVCYLVFSMAFILAGCHQSPIMFQHVLDAPQTLHSSAALAAPSVSNTIPALPESPQPHRIKSGIPLTIGPGYTCVILAKRQLEFLHATPIANAKFTCENSAYEIVNSSGESGTRLFLAIDDPTVFSHSNDSSIKVDTLNAIVQSVAHECQIIVDVLPDSPASEAITGRKLSLLLSNYAIPDKDNVLCNQAMRISSYVIPYVLG